MLPNAIVPCVPNPSPCSRPRPVVATKIEPNELPSALHRNRKRNQWLGLIDPEASSHEATLYP
jgi:hypothetical protein